MFLGSWNSLWMCTVCNCVEGQQPLSNKRLFQDLSVCPSFTTLMTAGVEHLLRDAKDNTIGTLSTNVDRMIGGLGTLKSRLLEVQQYLELVVAGKLPVNHDIIYNLQVCSLLSCADKVIGELSFGVALGVWCQDPEAIFYVCYPIYTLEYRTQDDLLIHKNYWK